MKYDEAAQKLQSLGQRHLLLHWESLGIAERQDLLRQVEELDGGEIGRLQAELQVRQSANEAARGFDAWEDFQNCGLREHIDMGREVLSRGQVGCLMVAGGQGSRLRFDGPKGMYPVSPIRHKTLFQIFSEKILAAGRQNGSVLPLAVMTSPQNHAQTVRFFEQHAFFGLQKGQVSFFQQKTCPFLADDGKLFLEDKGRIAMAPNGNGEVLELFYNAGIWRDWHEQGVRHIEFLQVDNPLSEPFDSNMIGCHVMRHADISIKAVLRDDPLERVGVFVERAGRPAIVEYSEISDEERASRKSDGSLKHACANIGVFCFSMDFVRRLSTGGSVMPVHFVRKAARYLDDNGDTRDPDGPNAWKCEKFIFDVFAQADRFAMLVYPRNCCFSPLKNASGQDSVETVRRDLLRREKGLFRDVTGREPPPGVFELHPQFYYPTAELREEFRKEPSEWRSIYLKQV